MKQLIAIFCLITLGAFAAEYRSVLPPGHLESSSETKFWAGGRYGYCYLERRAVVCYSYPTSIGGTLDGVRAVLSYDALQIQPNRIFTVQENKADTIYIVDDSQERAFRISTASGIYPNMELSEIWEICYPTTTSPCMPAQIVDQYSWDVSTERAEAPTGFSFSNPPKPTWEAPPTLGRQIRLEDGTTISLTTESLSTLRIEVRDRSGHHNLYRLENIHIQQIDSNLYPEWNADKVEIISKDLAGSVILGYRYNKGNQEQRALLAVLDIEPGHSKALYNGNLQTTLRPYFIDTWLVDGYWARTQNYYYPHPYHSDWFTLGKVACDSSKYREGYYTRVNSEGTLAQVCYDKFPGEMRSIQIAFHPSPRSAMRGIRYVPAEIILSGAQLGAEPLYWQYSGPNQSEDKEFALYLAWSRNFSDDKRFLKATFKKKPVTFTSGFIRN